MKKYFLCRDGKGPSVMAAGSFPGFQLIPGQLWESPQLTGIQNELVRLNKPVHQAASHWEECNPPITTPSPSLCFSVLTLVSQKRHQRKHSSAGPAGPAGGEGGFGLYGGAGQPALFCFVLCMTSGNNIFVSILELFCRSAQLVVVNRKLNFCSQTPTGLTSTAPPRMFSLL